MSRFKGREAEALEECIRRLAHVTDTTVETVEDQLEEVVTPVLTLDDIERKEYIYCQYFTNAVGLPTLYFLVPTVHKEVARRMAELYLRRRFDLRMNRTNLHLYPRNYIEKSRRLFAEGKFHRAGEA